MFFQVYLDLNICTLILSTLREPCARACMCLRVCMRLQARTCTNSRLNCTLDQRGDQTPAPETPVGNMGPRTPKPSTVPGSPRLAESAWRAAYLRLLHDLDEEHVVLHGVHSDEHVAKVRGDDAAPVVPLVLRPHNVHLVVSQVTQLEG